MSLSDQNRALDYEALKAHHEACAQEISEDMGAFHQEGGGPLPQAMFDKLRMHQLALTLIARAEGERLFTEQQLRAALSQPSQAGKEEDILDRVARAWGLLWASVADSHTRSGHNVQSARRVLGSLLTQESKRGGIAMLSDDERLGPDDTMDVSASPPAPASEPVAYRVRQGWGDWSGFWHDRENAERLSAKGWHIQPLYASPPAPEPGYDAEPVAWRWRYVKDRPWKYTDFAGSVVAGNAEVQPLYASPVPVSREEIAEEIWRRFAPSYEETFAECANRSEYLLAADAILQRLQGEE